jgi:hypothetical protein
VIARASLLLAAVLLGPAPAGPGELDARLVRCQVELDVFAPEGKHEKCSVRLLGPLALPPQVPLRISIRGSPESDVTGWRIDDEGAIVVDLADQVGEKHVGLLAQFDVLVMNGVGFDDTIHKTSLFKRAAATAVKSYTRPLAGAKPADPEVAKAAAELKGKSEDVLALVRAADDLAAKRIRDAPAGANDANEALKSGQATPLGHARVVCAIGLAHGLPARILGAVPSHERGDLAFLDDFHAGDAGWLRLDLQHRHTPAFPSPELDDVVIAEINADSPIAGNDRLKPFVCRGGLTAGPKQPGAPAYDCRELLATTCSRATAKEMLPLLAAAFADLRGAKRTSAEKLELLPSARVKKSAAALQWCEPLGKAMSEGE